MIKYPDHLLQLMQILKKLPGVGAKSAERFAFHLVDWKQEDLKTFAQLVASIKDKLKCCPECGSLLNDEGCPFCRSNTRDPRILCIVAHFKDVFALEETHEYKGLYHVLGGLLSPLDGIGPEKLNLQKLKDRLHSSDIQEIVFAVDSTLEGDATSLFLKKELASFSIPISRLAFGLPMGSSLDYVDGGTLARAFQGRKNF